jgi:hypothetical protein
MDIHSDITRVGADCLAGVEAHAHTHDDPLGPWMSSNGPLCRYGSSNRFLGARKDDEG